MLRTTRIPLILAAALLPAVGCQQETGATDPTATSADAGASLLPAGHPVARDITDLLENRWVAAFEAGDFQALAQLYTAEAWLMPPNFPRMAGRAAVAAYYEALPATFPPGTTVRFHVIEVEHYGNAASAVASYVIVGPGDAPLDQGHLVKVFHREAGEWKIHRSMFRSDLPPQ